MTNTVALILIFAITTYAVFGGADYGAGFWDLVAGGAEKGQVPRQQIDHSIGPVWEANHVWLIFTLVVMWTAFPEAFASIMLTMFVPVSLVALGIVLRGAGFAFRKAVVGVRERRRFGAIFALSSVIVPYCLGAVLGGISSGRVPAGGRAGDPWHSWVNPTSITVGLLAVSTCAFLAATFLIWDSRRTGNRDLEQYFYRRALVAACAAGVLAIAGIFVLHADARYVFDGLKSRALPLVIVSIVCGTTSLVLLKRRAERGARLFAIGAVASVVAGWGVAQWPYLLPTSLTVAQAASPSGSLTAVVVVFCIALAVIVPSIVLLYLLDQKGLLPEEGAATVAHREAT